MAEGASVTRIGPDTFLVVDGDTRATVYVAGPPNDRWAFWNGCVFRSGAAADTVPSRAPARRAGAYALTAPMPAAVIKVLVAPGATVSQGTPLVVLEAMKMELPVRALENGTVKAVYCREGDLVQADQVLIEMA
jgi:acetyl/propionyl-CoA carboxylase alpha subunit